MNNKGEKILIVDDEEDLCEILQYNLENDGFHTDVAHSAEDAMKKPLKEYDLILLDIMMGTMSGFKFADKIRKEMKIDVPVIFITAKHTENDLLTGFSVGADDYITKPFSVNELTARIKAVLKRSGKNKNGREVSHFGKIEIDSTRKRIKIGNKKIELTRKEFEILKLLLENNGKVFSREEILNTVWGEKVIVTERTVDVNITRLRSKLKEFSHCLHNKAGYGYYFEFEE